MEGVSLADGQTRALQPEKSQRLLAIAELQNKALILFICIYCGGQQHGQQAAPSNNL